MAEAKWLQKQRRNNCFETCLAVLLDIDQDEIPEYRGEDWLKDYDKWAQEKYNIRLLNCMLSEPFIYCIPEDVCFIVSGEVKEGGWHSRIMKNDKIIYDPSKNPYDIHDFVDGYHKWHATILIKDYFKT